MKVSLASLFLCLLIITPSRTCSIMRIAVRLICVVQKDFPFLFCTSAKSKKLKSGSQMDQQKSIWAAVQASWVWIPTRQDGKIWQWWEGCPPLSSVPVSDTSQSRAPVRSCMRKRVDSDFLCVCYTALWWIGAVVWLHMSTRECMLHAFTFPGA